MRRLAALLTLALAVVLSARASWADYLETSRSANLKEQPQGDAAAISHMEAGILLRLLEPNQTDGYYHAQPYSGGQAGWIYRTLVRRWPGEPENPPSQPAGPGTPASPGSNGGGEDASAYAIPNCPPEGNPSPNGSRYAEIAAVNRLKNRLQGPSPALVHPLALSAILAPGDDRSRWNTSMAVEVEGYVKDVKSGGKETCNCRSTDKQYWDTHIELTSGPNDEGLPMIVEVTPPWRAYEAQQGKDWSTTTLKSALMGHFVRVTGWLLFDSEHIQNSENTNGEGSNLWRRTAWEVHPITKIDIQSNGNWVSFVGPLP